MSLADFKGVVSKEFTIKSLIGNDGEPLKLTVNPITTEKAIDIISNYGIAVEELIFNKLDFEKLDDTNYLTNFGLQKFSEVISYIIACAANEPECAHIVHQMKWDEQMEMFNWILQNSLPDDKKKAEKLVQEILEMIAAPLLNLVKTGSNTNSEEKQKSEKL